MNVLHTFGIFLNGNKLQEAAEQQPRQATASLDISANAAEIRARMHASSPGKDAGLRARLQVQASPAKGRVVDMEVEVSTTKAPPEAKEQQVALAVPQQQQQQAAPLEGKDASKELALAVPKQQQQQQQQAAALLVQEAKEASKELASAVPQQPPSKELALALPQQQQAALQEAKELAVAVPQQQPAARQEAKDASTELAVAVPQQQPAALQEAKDGSQELALAVPRQQQAAALQEARDSRKEPAAVPVQGTENPDLEKALQGVSPEAAAQIRAALLRAPTAVLLEGRPPVAEAAAFKSAGFEAQGIHNSKRMVYVLYICIYIYVHTYICHALKVEKAPVELLHSVPEEATHSRSSIIMMIIISFMIIIIGI